MSGTSSWDPVPQPPYLAMAAALQQPDVLALAEFSAMRVAQAVLAMGGGALPGEPTDPPLSTTQTSQRLTLAVKVLGEKIAPRMLAIGLMQAPDVAAAVAANPSDAAGSMLAVDLAAAWARNWSDYAALIAAQG